jgi:hypothetical protein
MDGEVWDVDVTVSDRQQFSYRASPQQPAIEQMVRDLIVEMGFEPKVVTISKGSGGVFSGTAEAATGERFKVFEKTTDNRPKGEKMFVLANFSSESQIMVELVPEP